MEDCIFCKIGNGEIPSSYVYETENVYVINDIAPKAKHHMLVIPKKHYKDLTEVENIALLAALMKVVKEVTKLEGLNEYRVMINNGKSAGQEVFHLHIHILSNN